MSEIDIFYLSVVLVAFVGFAGTLAYVSHRDQERPSQSFPQFPFTNIPPFDTERLVRPGAPLREFD